MKSKFTLSIFLISIFFSSFAFASDYSCALLKFTDDTRYSSIGSADILSELVLEKLISCGQFTMREIYVIDMESEKMLYYKRAAELSNAKKAKVNKNYDILFEGEGFNKKKAENVYTAETGQVIFPEIIASLGKKHNVDYFIQGNILNLGTARQISDELGANARMVGGILSIFGAGKAGAVANFFGDTTMEENSLGVIVALRVIKAETGEVIWDRKVLGKSKIKKYSSKSNNVQIGNNTITNEIYAKAMNNAADTIIAALLFDIKKNRLFVR